jgi:hypothetical protein
MSNAGSITISNFKLYYGVIVTKKQHGTGTKTDNVEENGTKQ